MDVRTLEKVTNERCSAWLGLIKQLMVKQIKAAWSGLAGKKGFKHLFVNKYL